MSFDYEFVKVWVYPILFIICGILIGIIIEKILISRLKKIEVTDKGQGWKEAIVRSLRGTLISLFTIAGIYGTIIYVPMGEALYNILPNVLKIVVILLLTVFLARIAVGLLNVYSKRSKVVLPGTSIFVNLTKILVFLIGIMILLQSFGISITPILTALGVGGLAVALALQDTLSNFFAGLQIIASKQVRPGDYVKLESLDEGFVEDITWKNTTIKALRNNLIIIPNSKLSSTIITNYHLPEKEMSIVVPVGVSYDSDLKHVETVTIEVAKELLREIEGGVPEFEPFIRYNAFADSSINFNVILRVKEFVNQYPVQHEFIKKLHERYGKEGINIPFPIRTVFMKNSK